MVILADWLLLAISLIALLVASIFDINTGEIPDTLSYGLILSGLGIRLLHAITTSIDYFFFGLLAFAATFLLGALLYYTRQWGGGDAKLLMGIGVSLATLHIFQINAILVYLTVLVILGGLYSLIWAFVIYFKNYAQANKEIKKKLQEQRIYRIAAMLATLFFLLAIAFAPDFAWRVALGTIAIALILTFYLHIFIQAIHKIGFIKKIPIAKLTVGDWLAKDVKVNGKVLCSAKTPGIEKKQIQQLKKNKIKHVTIRIGIPFAPAMFISLVIIAVGVAL